MSAPRLTDEQILTERRETWRLLQSVVHYSKCTQMHLEVGDDAVAVYDFAAVEEYFNAARRHFAIVRAEFRTQVGNTEGAV